MNKINCNIMQDVLPIYIDGAVCEDTKRAVEAHLNECEACRLHADKLGRELVLPESKAAGRSEAKRLQRFRQNIRWKRLLAVLLAVAITAAVMAGIFYKIFVLGSPAGYAHVEVTPEILFEEDAYLNQAWVVHFSSNTGRNLNCRTEYIFAVDNAGVERTVGCSIYVNEMPDIAGTDIASYSWGYSMEDAPADPEQDFIVNVIFRDKKLVYSMRDVGLFEAQGVEMPEGGLENSADAAEIDSI